MLQLPTQLSKRKFYFHWCDERGRISTLNDKGGYTGKKKDKDNNEIDANPICCFKNFLNFFWGKKNPKLQLKNPSQDMCSSCYQFHHQVRTSLLIQSYTFSFVLLGICLNEC